MASPAAGTVASAGAAALGGRGAFIVFEGVDRSGKTTQAKALVDLLNAQGVKAEFWRFPGAHGVSVGRTVFKAARAAHVQTETLSWVA